MHTHIHTQYQDEFGYICIYSQIEYMELLFK